MLGISVRIAASSDSPEMQLRISPAADPRAGVGLKIDNHDDFRLPISGCDERVCQAVGRIRGPVRDQLTSGKYAQVAYFVGGKQQTVPVPLDGFAAALVELERLKVKGK